MTSYAMTPMNIVVLLVLLFSLALLVAWAVSPRLRARIEKPNYQFQRAAQSYDRSLQTATMAKGGKTL